MHQPDRAVLEGIARNVLDNLLEGCQVIGPDFRYLYVNDAVARQGRTTREQLLGRTMMEAYPGIEDTAMFAILQRCMRERSAQQMENEFAFSDGSKGWFELRFEPVPEGVAILSMDITARKRAEIALVRSNRALSALSECNQTLVRATDERQFMQGVCRIAVERGGYRMAWIGMKDGEGASAVQPVAWAGHDGDDLDRLPMIAEGTAPDPNPTIRAIGSGRAALARASDADASYAPWRQDARAREFASSIALPFHVAGACVGALNIYAVEPDAFDEAERELLDEMATDLGYGITTLRARLARQKAEARVVHLNAVLRGIRNVNQLITRERDPQALIQGTCELLVESRGFSTSSIVIGDKDRVALTAHAGAEAKLRRLRRKLAAGELPDCMRRAFYDTEIVVCRSPPGVCGDCPIDRDDADERDVVAVRLESEGKVFGALLVSFLPGAAADAEEIELFKEIAGDVAFALRSIELQAERRRAGEALERSEARYGELVANLEDVVFSTDAEGKIEYMSPAVERTYGFAAAEVVGRNLSEFIHPEDLPGVMAGFERTLKGAAEPFEFRGFDKEGRLRHLRSSGRVRLEGERPIGVDGVMIDFTALRQAQDALRASAERWRGTFDAITDMVCVIAADHTIAEINQAGCAALGLPRERIIGRRCSDLAHESRTPIGGCLQVLEARSLAAASDVYEQNGRSYELLAWPLCDPQHRPEGFVHIVKDITERKAADLALRESEHRYRSLFNNISVGIAHCRMIYEGDRPVDFIYLDVNSVFERLTGLKNVTGQKVSEVIPGIHESDPRLLEIYDRVARTGTPERFEIYVEALREWFDVSAYSPQQGYFVAVFDVITQRKRTEENLVKFSARLERLARVVQDLSQARSIEALVDIVRRAARALAGSDGATFVLRDGDLCHYVDEDAITPLWKGKKFPLATCISGWAMLHREPAVIEDIYADDRIPQDAYRPTFVKSLAMVPIRRENPIGAIGSYWARPYGASAEDVRILQALADSTSVALENVRVLRELEEGKARTRAIYDHLPNATLVWRRWGGDFALADFNEAAGVVTKGRVADFLGRPPGDLVDSFPYLAEDLASCFEHRAPVKREVECKLPGAEKPLRLVLTYGFIPADMVILHTEDVTEQHQVEEQLKLSQRLEAVGRLAGGVAHDFNNLLSVIVSYTCFAIEKLRETDPIRADLEEVQKAGQRAATLTRQLLAFSRKQVMQPEILNLNKVVTGIEGMLRRLLGEDIDILVRLAGDLGSVEADPGQIEQVIMNLAVNARDAMPQGGKLIIETANAELDKGYVEQHVTVKPGRFVRLSVTDTGCGMDAETQEHIFEPFFTTKEKGKGTGLGLATVYGIVRQSGGYLWVYSEPGRGSTFKIYLPRLDIQAPDSRRRATYSPATGNEVVLVVEDEDAVRKLAERILQSAGYRVLTAAGGRDALLLCERYEGRIDLLLTDVVMPKMSGRELWEHLVKLRPTLKVLYMSGYTDNAIVHHGVLDPGTHFVSKPFTVVDLTTKIRKVLDADTGEL